MYRNRQLNDEQKAYILAEVKRMLDEHYVKINISTTQYEQEISIAGLRKIK